MAARVDVGVHSHRDPYLGAPVGRDGGHAIELAGRLDVDRVDAGGDGERQLVARLADAREHDVARIEARAQRHLDLADRVRVGAAAEVAQDPQERER